MRLGLAFSPKRLSIAAGQSMTFFGDTTQGSNFAVHPLRPGGANGSDPGAGGNPIAAQNAGSSTRSPSLLPELTGTSARRTREWACTARCR